jgi:hypothetical protein
MKMAMTDAFLSREAERPGFGVAKQVAGNDYP